MIVRLRHLGWTASSLEQFSRGRMTSTCCLPEPMTGFGRVSSDALAIPVTESKIELGAQYAAHRRAMVPLRCLSEVLAHTRAFVEAPSQTALRLRITGPRSRPKPTHRRSKIASYTNSIAQPHRQIVLRHLVSGEGGLLVPPHGEPNVLAGPPPEVVAGRQVEPRTDMPLFSRLLPQAECLYQISVLPVATEHEAVPEAKLGIEVTTPRELREGGRRLHGVPAQPLTPGDEPPAHRRALRAALTTPRPDRSPLAAGHSSRGLDAAGTMTATIGVESRPESLFDIGEFGVPAEVFDRDPDRAVRLEEVHGYV